MDFLKKLQKLPESKRKIILWAVVITFALSLFIWWVRDIQKLLKNFQKEKIKEELRLPALKEELKEIPKFEVPKLPPEILKEQLKELEKNLSPEELQELKKFLPKQNSENEK